MATTEFYAKKIQDCGRAAAAQYARAARQTLVAEQIEAGVSQPTHSGVNTYTINKVFKTDGPEVAARFARLDDDQKFQRIAEKIEAGRWNPDFKSEMNGNGAGIDRNNGQFVRPKPKFLWKEPRRTGKTARAGSRAEIEKRRAENRAARLAKQPRKGVSTGASDNKGGKKGRG